MKLPMRLRAITVVLTAVAIAGLLPALQSHLQAIGNASIILTLVVLLVYTYYTYLLAKDAWTPSASFVLQPLTSNRHHLLFIIRNHSKQSLECWCDLNPKVCRQAVSLGGFYSGEHAWELQPFAVEQGHFQLKAIAEQAHRRLEDLISNNENADPRALLRLEIAFKYRAIGSKETICTPIQRYYFDFSTDTLIRDV